MESLATQTLVIFAIRTRRVPYFRSHPSLPLTVSALAVVAVGVLIPTAPFARSLGFAPLPATHHHVRRRAAYFSSAGPGPNRREQPVPRSPAGVDEPAQRRRGPAGRARADRRARHRR